MSCVTFTGGIDKTCENSIGGLSQVLLTDFDNITNVTETGGTVSAITMATASFFYEFNFNRNSATFAEDLTKDVTAGSAFFTQTVTMTIPRREVAKRNTLALLTQRDLGVIVKDANGLYWLVGRVEGAYLSEQASTSGTAKSDGNNYVLTLVAEELEQAPGIDGSIITALIA